ncbi:hypothetical protein MNBD_NITROSPINAE02-1409 [hydrothermal vent metagenome]|uniref:Cytochrome b/b6 C-terminal region profile domain-containing protein n=1 Tax=hydrothermal vent metagenome TaxID=652676 RepID=A0A3B1CI67_9ZZZZ
MSDLKLAKSGYMLANKPDYPRVSSWPYLIWVIFLSILFFTIIIWGVSFIADAPLEEEAAWAKTPNPAKAPWYFIGLQEMLVYFDPWIAGVLLPGQILVGLILIPFVDISPHAQGRYGWEDRKFAVSFFSFGMFIWFALIAVGQWFRGPSWEFYWPILDYQIGGHSWTYEGVPLKVTTATLHNMPNTIGLAFIVLFFVVGMILPFVIVKAAGESKIGKASKDYIESLGLIRYGIVQSHVVLTFFVVAKIVLRLTFGYKYVLTTPWFNI